MVWSHVEYHIQQWLPHFKEDYCEAGKNTHTKKIIRAGELSVRGKAIILILNTQFSSILSLD